MERKWILSAFVDISGFGTWVYRATIPRETKEPFIEEYLELVQAYVLKHREVHVKYLGDGFLAIKEFDGEKRPSADIFEFIKGLRCVTRRILKLIKDCPYPPHGARARITEGYAYKADVVDSFDKDKVRLIPEYIEYGINTAERLMEVNPDIVCVVTEGVARCLSPAHRSFFRMRKLGTPSHYPKSVNKEDLETLHVLKF